MSIGAARSAKHVVVPGILSVSLVTEKILMRQIILLWLLYGLPVVVLADQAVQVSGLVFDDRNGNTRRESDESGLPGIKLSNGRDIVFSDAAGRYQITVEAGQTVFLIKPPGYRLPLGADGLPAFWRHHLPEGSGPLRYGGIAPSTLDAVSSDFGLQAEPATDEAFEMLIFGDPQPKSVQDVDYYARDIVEPLVGKHAARLGISLGDIVDDDLSLYPAMKAVTAQLGLPWLHVAGNHDLDFDTSHDEQSLHSYRAAFGPDTFAWETSDLSIIGLDNVIYLPGQQPNYIGGLRPDQFEFLEAYLDTLPRQRLLVLAAHIPFFDTRSERETFRRADRERLFGLLSEFQQVLLLTAHSHVQQQVLHDAASGWKGATPLREYNVGAACGGFWGGVKDGAGIPEAMMADGTPNGYARLSLQPDGGYSLRWHAARDPQDSQIALHAPQVLRRGAYPAVGLYANVFMGSSDTRVEFRLGEGEWLPMQRVQRADPRVLRENLLDDAAASLRGFDRTPEASIATHLWRAALPTHLESGEHRIEVRADVPWRGWETATTHYRLTE